MSPFKPVTVGEETKLQLTLGATFALISTVVAHVIAATALFISVDRRIGSLEATVYQHERRIERVETKLYPTSFVVGSNTPGGH